MRLAEGASATPLTIDACTWEGPAEAPVVVCTVALAAPHELHALAWEGHDDAGAVTGSGGVGLAPWAPGEARRLRLALLPPPPAGAAPTTTIVLDPQ